MKKKDLWVIVLMVAMAGLTVSCNIDNSELGEDLLPAGDNVFLFYDTIFDINAYPVTGRPIVTSEISFDANKLMLLGNVQDTIVGSSVAELVTQFNTTSGFVNGPNMEIDTCMLSLQIIDYIGNKSEELTITVFEFTERITMDSIYYSNYSMEGKYDPIPLVEMSVIPEENSTLNFLIEDEDFLNKWLALETDTTYFRSDSVFKDYFNGFYITAHAASTDGVMARVHLANILSRVSLKYANDSTEIDSTAERDFVWSNFSINQYSSQKINTFEHDYTGTNLLNYIDDESGTSPYTYVQGMSGVNTKFSFTNMAEWYARNPVAINSANLVFEVVPEDESGISDDNLPLRLMPGTIISAEQYEPVYDYLVLLGNQQGSAFGGYKKADSQSMFSDTTFIYQFKMGLHFQYMVDQVKTDTDFILQLDDGKINPKITKLWSNLPTNKKRIRLEVVYTKL